LRKEAQEQGVEVGDADPLEACAAALGAARGAAERGAQRVAEAEALRTKLKIAKEEAEVAHLLGLHLKKDRFEGWLLNRALGNLAAGASEILRDISPQQPYSLRLSDDGDFLVVDHLNADEVRPAKSLSGGETFLASLSLALALAEQLAELAAEGTSRLEALFLDEGFGTLDAESLDVVAGAITELGAKGRMVGLVTHVPELAARMPVRYEVRKTPSGSVVERVVA
jgi:exonuclease SbcC